MIVVMLWLYNEVLTYIHGRDDAHARLPGPESRNWRRAWTSARAISSSQRRIATVRLCRQPRFAGAATNHHQLYATACESRYKGRLDEDADEFIGYIVTSSRRMTDLINGLLALVRLRKSGPTLAPVSFEKLLQEAEISLQAADSRERAEIQHGPLPALVVDHVQFSQVLAESDFERHQIPARGAAR